MINQIDDEVFNVTKIQIRTLKEVPAVIPFQDSTMGPFNSFGISILTLQDEDGRIGESPVLSSYSNIFENCIFPILFHERNLSYKELYPKLYWSIRNEGFRGPASALLGQLDMALYDLASRRKGIPLHRYLNAERNEAKAYGSGGGTNYTYAQLEKEVRFFLDCGMSCIKIKVGKDFGSKMAEDIERVKFVRKLVGKDVRLAVDANQIWNVGEALTFLRGVEEQDIAWFEEPVHSASLTEVAQLCSQSAVSISFGESERTSKVFPELVRSGVTHLQPTPTHLGSIREWMEVRDLAVRTGLTFSSGGYSCYTAALMVTSPETFQVEYLYTLMKGIEDYFAEYPRLKEGRFVLPEIEGIPIRIDWKYLEEKNKIKAQKTWTIREINKYKPLVLL